MKLQQLKERMSRVMKKKVSGAILAAVLLVTQSVTAFAAGSRTADVQLPGDNANFYEVAESSEETFSYLNDLEDGAAVVEKILAVNEGTATLQSIAEEMAPELQTELETKEMVTPFFELTPVNGGVMTEDGNYEVTISVPTLTRAMVNVRILHFSTERNLWELITPSDVDYADQAITAEFEDLSPIAVVSDIDDSQAAVDNAEGTSPKTGAASDWMLWLGAAFVLAAGGVVVYRKAR